MEQKYFCGNPVSEYGVKNGRVDYRCLAKAFDAVLANSIMGTTGYEDWELESGSDVYYEDSEGNIYYSWNEMDDRRDELQDRINELNDIISSSEPDFDGTWNDWTEEQQKIYDEWEENIQNKLEEQIEELEREIEYLEDEHYEEVYQYYIIDSQGAELLKDYTHELVWYNEELDLYLWGVTHWGTSWDYVLTEIAC